MNPITHKYKIMEYRLFIRQLVADIINGKKDYSYITSPRDFFYIQTTFLKMHHISRVVEMGKISREKNLKNGIDLEKDINDVAKPMSHN